MNVSISYNPESLISYPKGGITSFHRVVSKVSEPSAVSTPCDGIPIFSCQCEGVATDVSKPNRVTSWTSTYKKFPNVGSFVPSLLSILVKRDHSFLTFQSLTNTDSQLFSVAVMMWSRYLNISMVASDWKYAHNTVYVPARASSAGSLLNFLSITLEHRVMLIWYPFRAADGISISKWGQCGLGGGGSFLYDYQCVLHIAVREVQPKPLPDLRPSLTSLHRTYHWSRHPRELHAICFGSSVEGCSPIVRPGQTHSVSGSALPVTLPPGPPHSPVIGHATSGGTGMPVPPLSFTSHMLHLSIF